MNPVKALPYAVGGLLGGTAIKAMFKKKGGAAPSSPSATTTPGVVGPSPSAMGY